ncbi:MAG: SPOR domain-containing protein [Bacteroidota bacterium]
MKQIVLLLLLLSGSWLCKAQELQVNEPPLVAQMVKNWTNNNRSNPHIEGWRVQIMASTDRTQVEEGRTRFRSLYPEVPADWIHEKPYYKLKVGAFKSKLEAMAFISTLTEFPGAYPAKDANIHPRDFLKQ